MFWSSWQAYLLVEFLQKFGLFLGTALGERDMFFFFQIQKVQYNTIQTLLTLPKEGFSVTII